MQKQCNADNRVVAWFVYASKSNVPDSMVKGGITYRFITDQLGSVRLVVNSQTGEIAQQLRYDEFGVVLEDTNPGFQPFGFAGGLYDSDTVNFIDPTGEVANFVLGALFGAGADLLYQMVVEGKSFGCVDFGQVAIAGAMGTVGGGSLDKLLKLSKAGKNVERSVKPKAIAEKPALPDDYWINKGSLEQVTPGTRVVNDYHKASSSGGTYHQTTHYDQFGRLIGRTDRTSHGDSLVHPNPHHHRINPINGERLKNSSGSRVWPGLFGN